MSPISELRTFKRHLTYAGNSDGRFIGYRQKNKPPVIPAIELRERLVTHKCLEWYDARSVYIREVQRMMYEDDLSDTSFYYGRLWLERHILKRAARDPITLTCDAALFVRMTFRASDFQNAAKLDNLRQFMKSNNFCIPAANAGLFSEGNTTDDKPPDQTVVVDLPALIIMNEINTTGFNGLDQCSMAVVSAAKFLLSLGISGHPVFGLVVDGPLCTLLCAEHRHTVRPLNLLSSPPCHR